LDYRWQAQAAKGFDAASFSIDWTSQQATCPRGKISLNWTTCLDTRKREVVKIKFSTKDCGLCPSQADCTKAKWRTITLRREDRHLALTQAREREKSKAFVDEYAQRAGIEGTISQAVRAFGARRAKYIGQAKTHLQHVLIASAINFTRISNWLAGKQPAQTRQSAFQKLFTPPTPY
jgi:transposase